MKHKSRFKKNIQFLFVIFVLCIAVFGGYYLITGKENPLTELIDQISNDNKIVDNYNGVYVSKDDLNGSKYMFRGCSVSYISNYILIIDDDYYLFRSSCMGTFPKGNGKTEDLHIQVDEEKNTYKIQYDDREYMKDSSILSIVPSMDLVKEITSIQPDTYQLLMQETQYDGYYYDLKKARIEGISSNLAVSIGRNEMTNSFDFSIGVTSNDYILYSYSVADLESFPNLYPYGKNLVIIEKNQSSDKEKYAYRFKVLSEDGVSYNSDTMFPIVIDDVTLSTENSIYITFDSANRNFRMLIGDDKNFCTDDYSEEEKNDIAYYEFTIDYDYSTFSFLKPKFSKIGYKSEGCKYINKVMGG